MSSARLHSEQKLKSPNEFQLLHLDGGEVHLSWTEDFWSLYDLAAQRGDLRCLERGLG